MKILFETDSLDVEVAVTAVLNFLVQRICTEQTAFLKVAYDVDKEADKGCPEKGPQGHCDQGGNQGSVQGVRQDRRRGAREDWD